MLRPVLFFCLLFLSACISFAQKKIELKSPDNHITTTFFVRNDSLLYSVQYGEESICTNTYGFQLAEHRYGTAITNLRIVHQETVNRDFDVRGVHSIARTSKNVYHILIGSLDRQKDFDVFVYVYNNGVALSYAVQHHNQKLERDLSTTFFPESATYWWQGDVVDYEGNYSQSNISELKEGQQMGMPLTVSFPSGTLAAVMESNLVNFSGMHFVVSASQHSLIHTLAGRVEPHTPVVLQSPWYIIMLSKDLNGLVNNDIVSDVANSPDKHYYPQGLHTDWIKPGMALWSWMSNDRSVTPENMKRFTDYASALHISYNLIDEGWSYWKADGKDCWDLLKEQVDYAASKNIGIWIWKAYPDRGNVKGLKDSADLNQFMKKCSELGVKGLKIDFFDSEKQPEIAFYGRAALLAAKYHLMIDYHGANKATGLEYTYPNVLTQEGVRGLEQEYNVNWPFHNTVLPFTRYLSGPADFTPMSFRPFVYATTLAHQAATVVIYTSPFLCMGVDPADLLKSQALSYIENMPTTWDETIVLKESQLGKVAAFARRKGKKWYLAITNGEIPTSLHINLSFLSGKTNYALKQITDSKMTRTSSFANKSNINQQAVLHIDMPYGGGYLGIFE
ncbi:MULTISPECIES: glycoside hydrolase family 97 catalytic domain-containing protein [Chitinophagaceae]